MRDVKGTGGVAARSVLPRRDGSSRTLCWVMPKWAVCNPGYGGQGGGKGLSMDLGQEPGRDAPIAHQTPFSCFSGGKSSFLLLCSQCGQRSPSHRGSAPARTRGRGPPLPLHPSVGSTSQGWIHPPLLRAPPQPGSLRAKNKRSTGDNRAPKYIPALISARRLPPSHVRLPANPG